MDAILPLNKTKELQASSEKHWLWQSGRSRTQHHRDAAAAPWTCPAPKGSGLALSCCPAQQPLPKLPWPTVSPPAFDFPAFSWKRQHEVHRDTCSPKSVTKPPCSHLNLSLPGAELLLCLCGHSLCMGRPQHPFSSFKFSFSQIHNRKIKP